jgi:putative two-component system response regulator
VKHRILLVDDEVRVLESLRRMLHSQRQIWETTCVDQADDAWEHLMDHDVDTVVMDIKMPGTSGLELLARMQQTERTKDVPVVMLTGLADHDLKRRALELGAADLLNKPVDPADLLARLRSVLRLKVCQDELKAYNALLEQKVEERTLELAHSRLDIIWQLGKVAEQRDEYTGNHVVRVGFYSRQIAEGLRMSHAFQETIFLAAPLHDIGKIAVPDRILLKPGPLNDAEIATMRHHCYAGAKILKEESLIRKAFFHWRAVDSQSLFPEFKNPILEVAASIALTHHERWDGNGYPEGLSGESIPLESRIVAIADVYDSLTSTRPYRIAYPEERALQIIQEGAASHFDPQVHAAFFSALPELRLTRQRFVDEKLSARQEEEAWDEESVVCRR